MKRSILSVGLVVAALSCLAFVSCDKDTEVKTVVANVPTLTFNNITVDAAGGQYNIYYTVANEGKNGTVSATPGVSWITNVTANAGAISVTIAANTSAEMRSGNVTVTYNYTDANGSSESVTEVAGVIQYGLGAPELSVQPNAVTASYGDSTYSFNYTINNAVDDGKLTCKANVEWIDNFDYTTYGKVGFTVDENELETLRTGTITVSYAYSGTTLTKEVTVIQDHGATSGGAVDITIDELVGTYTCTGYTQDQTYSGTTSWDVKIFKTGTNEVTIDGLVRAVAGLYPSSTAGYVARGSLNSLGQLVIPSQMTGYIDGSLGIPIGWTPCVMFVDSSNWAYSEDGPDCTLTLNPSTGVWTSDYGEICAAFTSETSWASLYGYYGLTAPGFTLVQTSTSTGVTENTSSVAVEPVLVTK